MSELTLCIGATGAQGGSVVRALRAAGQSVRALTRNPRSPAARALASQGVALVEGDLSDLAGLCTAMRGCQRVFAATNYWEHFGGEVVHGRNVVDAAQQVGVAHLVLSTLPSAELRSGGTIAVPHMESKAAIEAYARASGLTVSFVHVAFYFENFLSWFVPRPEADGVLSFGFPQGDTPLAGVSVEDVGPVVASLFADLRRAAGQTVGVVADEQTGEGYARHLAAALQRPVRYRHIERADYAQLPFPGAADLAAMFDFNRRFLLSRSADLQRTRELHPGVSSFAAWSNLQRDALRKACSC